MQNKLMIITMSASKKTAVAHLPETAMLRLVRLIDTAIVYPWNEFARARTQRVLDDSYIQVPAKHDFS